MRTPSLRFSLDAGWGELGSVLGHATALRSVSKLMTLLLIFFIPLLYQTRGAVAWVGVQRSCAGLVEVLP